jgi:hypothetical protein
MTKAACPLSASSLDLPSGEMADLCREVLTHLGYVITSSLHPPPDRVDAQLLGEAIL